MSLSMLAQRCSTSGHSGRSRSTCCRTLSESTCVSVLRRSVCTATRRTVKLQSGKDPGQTYNSSSQTQEKAQNADTSVKTASGPESSALSGAEERISTESTNPQSTGAEMSKDSVSASTVRIPNDAHGLCLDASAACIEILLCTLLTSIPCGNVVN